MTPILGIDIGGGSVKSAGVVGNQTVWTGQSNHYAGKPTRATLVKAIAEAVGKRDHQVDVVGLCVPGLLDEKKERVTLAVNVPSLQETPLADLVRDALGDVKRVLVANDANAAAWDLFTDRGFTDRMLCLVLGTGVGAAIADPCGPLRVEGESPGHIGQIDVSLEGEPVIGSDGGAGCFEAYIGSAALKRYYGDDPAEAFRKMKPTDPPIRALVRAIRICHAIYRPKHVVLAGGTGIRMASFLPAIKSLTDTHLTSVARSDWDLSLGVHDHHAASGASKLAGRG